MITGTTRSTSTRLKITPFLATATHLEHNRMTWQLRVLDWTSAHIRYSPRTGVHCGFQPCLNHASVSILTSGQGCEIVVFPDYQSLRLILIGQWVLLRWIQILILSRSSNSGVCSCKTGSCCHSALSGQILLVMVSNERSSHPGATTIRL
jgi:hypothetical protein